MDHTNNCYNVVRVIKIQYIGSPQTGDIIASVAEDNVKCLDKVSTLVLPSFNTMAIKLIEEKGAVEVVLAALTYISTVTTEIKSRSLLSSQPQVILYTIAM